MRTRQHADLVLTLDGSEPGGLRRRLTEQLQSAILGGIVAPGESLPSTRVLAAELGISRGTVVAAYDDLAGEGYIDIVRGSGAFVADAITAVLPGPHRAPAAGMLGGPAAGHRSRPDEAVVPSAGDLPHEGTSLVRPKAGALSGSAMTGQIDLRPGHPSTRTMNARDWASAWRAAAREPLPPAEPPAEGLPALRHHIAQHLRPSRGLDCSSEDIVITAGTSDAMMLLTVVLRELCGRSPRVACEQPGHAASRRVLRRFGAETVMIPVVDGGMDLRDLERVPGLDAALVTPSHQYPLGGRLDIARRLELLDWAGEGGSFVIEDDYDSEFRGGARALPAVASLDRAARVIHIGSFSKVLSPWLRCGYIVTKNDAVRSALARLRQEIGTPVSGVAQSALAHYLATGALRRHLARVRREYAHRRDLIVARLADLRSDVTVSALDGGLHAVLSWKAADPIGRTVRTALQGDGIEVSDLREYYDEPDGSTPEGIVIGYGACTDLQLVTAVDRLRGLLS